MLVFHLAALESIEDRQRFTTLYEQYHEQMEKTALKILKNQHDAEDAVQNAFLKIIQNFERIYEIPCNRRVFWCVCIVKNESRSLLRKIKKTSPLEDWEGFTDNISDELEYKEVLDLIARMPDTYRTALEMRLVMGCSGKEIAEHLGISENAVNVRIARGREQLIKIAEKEGYLI